MNAARVSLAKGSKLVHKGDEKDCWASSQTGMTLCTNMSHWVLSNQDKKLLKYLATHNHWTPFAHSSLYLKVTWRNAEDELLWYKYSNPAGFQRVTLYNEDHTPYDILKGSFIGWVHNMIYLSTMLRDYVEFHLHAIYPESTKVFFSAGEPSPLDDTYLHGGEILSESVLQSRGIYNIIAATLRIKVPIAIARQIRTSQVGFAYNDLYVEGDSFSFNEVSRRYVNDDPEFYTVEQWRVREGKSVKQGSTGLASVDASSECKRVELLSQQGLGEYRYLDLKYHIAPEQLRFLLPQSMYTEFYMTGTLQRWAQFIQLRSQPDIQEETREITSRIAQELRSAYPEWYTQSLGDVVF